MKKNSNWKGYDMEQLHILHATTQLRIDIEKQRIANMFSGNQEAYNKAGKMAMSTAGFMEAAEYGLKTYRLYKKVSGFFHKKKKTD